MGTINAIRRMSSRERIQASVEMGVLGVVVLFTIATVFATDFTEAALLLAMGTIIYTQLQMRMAAVATDPLIEEITPTARELEFNKLTDTPQEWTFRGGSGRWFRSTAVPAVAAAATSPAPVRAILLDPRNEETCTAYARYRYRSGWYDDHTITPRGIQAEILATILVLLDVRTRTRVRPHAGLSQTYGPSRIDANGEHLILTTPDQDHPPLRVDRRHWFYDVMMDEVAELLENGPVVDWPEADTLSKVVQAEELARLLGATDVVYQVTGRKVPILSEYAEAEVDWELVHRVYLESV